MPRTSKIKKGQVQQLANVIGDRGEHIFELLITDYSAFQSPLFKPGFLGEKWPTVDYYVALQGVRGSSPFFFVQVKATTAKLSANAKDIRIQATKNDVNNLFKIPGPTYLAGVHEPSKRVFIRSLHSQPQKGIYLIPLKNELTPNNLKILYDEVKLFWAAAARKPLMSNFT